jgi:hypothetical protein
MIKYKVVLLIYLGTISDNKINFGFGEMDDDYKVIENLGNNEYLKKF